MTVADFVTDFVADCVTDFVFFLSFKSVGKSFGGTLCFRHQKPIWPINLSFTSKTQKSKSRLSAMGARKQESVAF